MKKLGKKNHEIENTIQAYDTCSCDCGSSCFGMSCTCTGIGDNYSYTNLDRVRTFQGYEYGASKSTANTLIGAHN